MLVTHTYTQVRKSDIKISNRFLSDRIRSCNNIVCDHTRSYEKAYEKSSSQISDINSYTKSRIWPNNTILHDHIRSYNKILINLFTVIPIFECCYIKYRSNRLRIFQKFFVFRITSLVTNVRFTNNNETNRNRLRKK